MASDPAPPLIVIPLYAANGDRGFRHWGSGILLTAFARFWLVTAAHVSEGDRGAEVLICAGIGPLHPLPHPVLATKRPANGDRKGDKIDLAIAPVDVSLAEKLISLGFSFAPETAIVRREIMRVEDLVHFGFPHNLQECENLTGGTRIEIQPVATHTRLVSSVEAQELGYSTDSHLVLRYNPSASSPLPSQTDGTPLPPGTSGGAVLLREGRQYGIAGVTIRWFDPGYIVATKATSLLPMMLEAIRLTSDGR